MAHFVVAQQKFLFNVANSTSHKNFLGRLELYSFILVLRKGHVFINGILKVAVR